MGRPCFQFNDFLHFLWNLKFSAQREMRFYCEPALLFSRFCRVLHTSW